MPFTGGATIVVLEELLLEELLLEELLLEELLVVVPLSEPPAPPAPPDPSDSEGGGRQVNVNDRNAWIADPRTGQKLNPTGETAADYRSTVSQDVARRPLDYSKDVPIAGDSGAQVINRGGAVGTTTGDPDSGGDP